MRALSLISLTRTMWSEQSGDNSHDESHEPGRDGEERANEEEEEIPLFEQLDDLSVLEPDPQVARSLATRLAALTIHGIVDIDRPVGCSPRMAMQLNGSAPYWKRIHP